MKMTIYFPSVDERMQCSLKFYDNTKLLIAIL